MATIRQNALCIDLAHCLYALSGPYHGTTLRSFDAIPDQEKQRWIAEAESSFESVRPLMRVQPSRPDYFDLATGLAQKEAAKVRNKVIAQITPAAPWGIDMKEGA